LTSGPAAASGLLRSTVAARAAAATAAVDSSRRAARAARTGVRPTPAAPAGGEQHGGA
jgi:hypothetical protein